MTIKAYKINDQQKYEVYICTKSQIVPGLRVQKRATKIETLAEARRIEKTLTVKCIDELRVKESIGRTWGDIVDKWQSFRRASNELLDDTIDDYVSMMKIWTQNFWDKEASLVTKSDVRATMDLLIQNKKSNSFQTKVLHTIARVYRWGKEEGHIKGCFASITSGIKSNKIFENPPEILTREEMLKLLLEAKRRNNPWYPVWATAIHTGMRCGEIFVLQWNDIDLINLKITVSRSYNRRKRTTKSTKSGYYRTIPINAALKEILIELKTQSINDYVFPSIPGWANYDQARHLKFFCAEIGIKPVKFHTLRACFATHLLSQGVPAGVIQRICGWNELKTMARYVRLSGVEVRGATDGLSELAPKNTQDCVVSMADFR
jgi:integrase